MYWTDEGYLLSKNNFDENSLIIEVFTLNHGKYSGLVYGGSSRKQKRIFQIGNKILLNWRSKSENKPGYFNVELINPVVPLFIDDKKRSISILSAASILKILLPERQINEKIYENFEKLLNNLKTDDWINLYIKWELTLIKDLGYESKLSSDYDYNIKDNIKIKKALSSNKKLLIENFILPNKLKFPLYRNILENYYS
tara:strand:+ start:4392 stop:4985 length:594 start_codon:yes stop_codon:yes gene_type:complete